MFRESLPGKLSVYMKFYVILCYLPKLTKNVFTINSVRIAGENVLFLISVKIFLENVGLQRNEEEI